MTARVKSSGHKKKTKKAKVTTITVGSGAYSVGVGQTSTVIVPLNSAGVKQLRKAFKLAVTVTLPGTSVPGLTTTFKFKRISIVHALVTWTVTVGQSTAAHHFPVQPVPKGSKLKLACHGRGCPFGSRSLKAKQTHVTLTGLFGSAQMKPGTKVTLAITKNNFVGEIVSWVMQSAAVPSVTVRCLPPGSHRAVKC